jgi:tRNA U34 5-carboxymethylaminomethyl modifying GTPase MnmE/TrmE
MNFKVLIVGEAAVGKGSFINMCKYKDFKNIGPIDTYLYITTNKGPIRLQLTQSRTYEENYDSYLVMFDLSRPITTEILQKIPHNNKPRVIIGNKSDLSYAKKVANSSLIRERKTIPHKYPYYDISVKMNRGVDAVISCLLKQLIG